MTEQFIMAIDQGTTSTRVILYNHAGVQVGVAQKELPQIFSQPGWVEHDALIIWQDTQELMKQVLVTSEIDAQQIASIGITNQRETTVLWDTQTGQPVAPAIVWQSKQSDLIADQLQAQGLSEESHAKTGLWVDSYFSATKVMWLLENVAGLRERVEHGEIKFGTIDTWLLWNLTNRTVHATDYTNASRTMMFNIHELKWDQELLQLLNIPANLLPTVKNSADNYGTTTLNGVEIPITALAGDQQAALFGHQAFEVGAVKTTFGTGSFIVMNTGNQPQTSSHGLLTTIAYALDGKITYALEGSVFAAGAAIQWLRDGMEMIPSAQESSELAFQSLADQNGQIYVVPAFTGLGAPYWDQNVRGAMFGLTRATTKNDITRATIEAIAFQTRDVLEAMQEDTGNELTQLVIDGGAAANDYLHTFLADLLQINVTRPQNLEMTSRGIAYLSGIQSGFWENQGNLPEPQGIVEAQYQVNSEQKMQKSYQNWVKAVESARMFPSR